MEIAARLQRLLGSNEATSRRDEETAERERIKIALWLRREFSDETPGERTTQTQGIDT